MDLNWPKRSRIFEVVGNTVDRWSFWIQLIVPLVLVVEIALMALFGVDASALWLVLMVFVPLGAAVGLISMICWSITFAVIREVRRNPYD